MLHIVALWFLSLVASFATQFESIGPVDPREGTRQAIERLAWYLPQPEKIEETRAVIAGLVARHPEVLPELVSQYRFRSYFPLGRLLEFSITDVEYVSAKLADPYLLSRVCAGLQLAHAGVDAAYFVEYALSALNAGRFERQTFRLADLQPVDLVDVEDLLDLIGVLIERLPGDTSGLRALLRGLPALPKELERTAFGATYEVRRLGLWLGRRIDEEQEVRRDLVPMILDPSAPRLTRLAAARVLRPWPSDHPVKRELERVIRERYAASRPRRWWRRAEVPPPEDFFRDQGGAAVDLFRSWGSRDEGLLHYLLEVADGRGKGEITPAHVAEILVDLDWADDRFLAFFRGRLAKTGATNMPLFFAAFLKLWPARSIDIAEALFRVHVVPELLASYLEHLVDEGARAPRLVDELRLNLANGRIPSERQLNLDGLGLADWIDREIRRRSSCQNSLAPQTPTSKDHEHEHEQI